MSIKKVIKKGFKKQIEECSCGSSGHVYFDEDGIVVKTGLPFTRISSNKDDHKNRIRCGMCMAVLDVEENK